MQNRYAGDVGDFGKLSLLRFLFHDPQYRIGIIWYLFPNESYNEDGRHIEYLSNRKFLEVDEDVCRRLSVVVNNDRSVGALENSGLFPPNTIYFSEALDFHLTFPSQKQIDRENREEGRGQWLEKAITVVSACNVLFLDPDNGLETSSCSGTSRLKSGKYAYYSEIGEFAKGKDATVVYHHLSRTGTHMDQISRRIDALRQEVGLDNKIFALRYWPYSPRAYFILAAKSEENKMRRRLLEFLGSRFGKFWDCFLEDGI